MIFFEHLLHFLVNISPIQWLDHDWCYKLDMFGLTDNYKSEFNKQLCLGLESEIFLREINS